MSNISVYSRTWPSLLGSAVLDSLFQDDFQRHLQQTTSGYPVADIYREDDGSTILEFALAGFSREELSIDILPDKNSITVSASSDDDDSSHSTRRIARRSFKKTYVNYDNNLDLSLTVASFNNGLLTITVPRKPEDEPIAINID